MQISVAEYKQRVARPDGGKSSGFRTIILFRAGTQSVFAYGFPKNQKGNISLAELAAFKRLADEYLNLDERLIDRLLVEGRLTEIPAEPNDDDNDDEQDEEDEEEHDDEEQAH